MPGVELAKFSQQLDHLATLIAQPDDFLHEYKTLMDFYSDRTYRAGEKVTVNLRLPSYHLPNIVVQNLRIMLKKKIPVGEPEKGLRIANLLWHEPTVESRTLAVLVLGAVRTVYPTTAIQEIHEWIRSPIEIELLKEVMDNGARNLRDHFQTAWLEEISSLLLSSSVRYKIAGLLALLPYIRDEKFKDIPKLFELIYPVTLSPSSEYMPDLLEVLGALVKRSPIETGSYLANILSDSPTPGLLRIIRKLMPSLDATAQARMRTLLERQKETSAVNDFPLTEPSKSINKPHTIRKRRQAKPLV